MSAGTIFGWTIGMLCIVVGVGGLMALVAGGFRRGAEHDGAMRPPKAPRQ